MALLRGVSLVLLKKSPVCVIEQELDFAMRGRGHDEVELTLRIASAWVGYG